MKYLILGLLVIACFQSCQMKTGDLNGNVESFTSLKYEAVEKFGDVTKGRPQEASERPYEQQMANVKVEYDIKGKEQKFTKFNTRGGIEYQGIRQDDPLKFDLFDENGAFQGRIILDHAIYPKTTSTYNDNGALIQKTLTDYNSSSLPVIEHDYNSIGEWVESREYQYNEKNRIKMEKHTTLIPGNYWSEPDTTISAYFYAYNEHDDISECKILEKKGESLINFAYTYDQNKNWIVCILSSGVKPLHYFERSITYR